MEATQTIAENDEGILIEENQSATTIWTQQRKRLLWMGCSMLVAALAAIYYFQAIAPFESTDNAFVEGHVVAISPQVAGKVLRLLIQDNQDVKRGDLLLEIDPQDYETKVMQAKANLTRAQSSAQQAKAQLSVDEAGVERERASLVAAEAEAARATRDLKRYQAVESRAVSQTQIDAAATQAKNATAQVAVVQSRVEAAKAQVELSKANVETAQATIQQAEAALRQAELDLSYTKVIAPEDGRITKRSVESGSYIQVGQVLMAMVPSKFWVVANFKETQLTHMRPGQPVEVKVDAYPQLKIKAHVDSIQTGAGARFSLFPPENATGNYVKVVQRVPVKIVFDELNLSDAGLLLGPGMSVEPRVRVK